MRVSIVGGLERLSKEYVNACKGIGCKAKVYNKLSSNFEESLKCSQCVLLLIGLSSHKMADTAKRVCKKNNIPFICLDKASTTSITCAMKEFMDCGNCTLKRDCASRKAN